MAVARNLRTYPLSLKTTTAYSLNAGIVSAYDYAGDPSNAFAGGNGAPHVGAKTLGTSGGIPSTVEVVSGVWGRDYSIGSTANAMYTGLHVKELGFGTADGKGPFTIHRRYRTPSAFVGATPRTIATYRDGVGSIGWNIQQNSAGYCYIFFTLPGGYEFPGTTVRTSAVNLRIPDNSIVDVTLVYDGTTAFMYLNGVQVATMAVPNMACYNTQWTGIATTEGPPTVPLNLVAIDHLIWNRALSAPEVTQYYNDPYAGYNNTAVVPNGIKITGPVPGAIVSSEAFTVSGTYSGSTPTSIQARFNGAAWATIVATPSGGSFSGTVVPTGAATGLLEVRYGNNTAITDSITVTTQQPLPSVSITSQGNPDGQSIAFNLLIQRTATLQVQLTATGNGAVTQAITTNPAYSTVAASTTINFTGVASGDYSVTITATNSTGNTVISGAAFSIMGVDGGGNGPGDAPTSTVPSAPTGVSAVAGNGKATISFTPPTNNGGSELTGFKVTASTGQTATGEASPITVAVPNGVAVTFTVVAMNVVGSSVPSAASNSVTPVPTIPGQPRSVSATARSKSALVSFTAPLDNGGSAVNGYEVTSSLGEVVNGVSSPLLVDSPDGVVVTFTVKALNSVGKGPASDPTQPVTPGSVPDAPTQVVAVPRNGSAVVSFVPPEIDGGWPVLSYNVVASSGQTANGEHSPVSIVVPRDVPVTFTVAAVNTIGVGAASAPSDAVTPRAPVVRLKLIAPDGTLLPNLNDLRWAWHDEPTPDLWTTTTDKGSVENTDITSELLIPMLNSTKWIGDVGSLTVTDSTGDPSLVYRAFCGPAVLE